MTDTMEPSHIEWSRSTFNRMSNGGTWAIPKCGLIFSRRGDALVLIAAMPHDPKMPITADELREQQQAMYDDCKRHFEAAGIPVRSELKESIA